jgi:hypothetical protein
MFKLFQTADDTLAFNGTVQPSRELRRILNLPQRDTYALGKQAQWGLTAQYSKSTGCQTLRPLQAAALHEIKVYKGGLVLLPVGEGKTLISFLAGNALGEYKKVLLLTPAALREKTIRDFAELEKHWQGGADIMSYEKISRDQAALLNYSPKVIIADECHCLGNYKSGVVRRIGRYLNDHPDCVFVGMSGTLTSRKFKDWWLLQRWALPAELRPLPDDLHQLIEWAEAVDEKIPAHERRRLGALKAFGANLSEARSQIGKIIAATPGIITSDKPFSACPLRLRVIQRDPAPAIGEALDKLRSTWETPDGQAFSMAADLWRHARELANGFYYRLLKQPTLEQMEVRRVYHSFIREKLRYSHRLDTESAVRLAFPDAKEVRAWLQIKDTFPTEKEPVWLDTSVVEAAAEWAMDSGGLVWVEHRAVGEYFEHYGIPFFSVGGLDKNKKHIYDHRGPAAVSVRAIGKGLNLQHYSKGLVLNCTPKGSVWEQMLGRKHRSGQTAPEVLFIILLMCMEQKAGFEQALKDADYITRITNQTQKLKSAKIELTGCL